MPSLGTANSITCVRGGLSFSYSIFFTRSSCSRLLSPPQPKSAGKLPSWQANNKQTDGDRRADKRLVPADLLLICTVIIRTCPIGCWYISIICLYSVHVHAYVQKSIYYCHCHNCVQSGPIMAHDPPIQRTAPIAIAPKPPRLEPLPLPRRQNSSHRFEIGPASLHGRGSIDSGSFPGAPAPPCQACRFSGTRCTVAEDDDGCMPCQLNGTECSLVSSSPQTRKRKLNGDSADESVKRGSVQLRVSCLVLILICFLSPPCQIASPLPVLVPPHYPVLILSLPRCIII